MMSDTSAWMMVRQAPLVFRPRSRVTWVPMLLVATFFAIGSTLTIVGVANTKVANVVCISATAPLVAALIAPWATGERTTPGLWFACGAALLGAGSWSARVRPARPIWAISPPSARPCRSAARW